MLIKRQTLFLILFILGLLIVLINKHWPDQQVHLIFCDVGQGDAILLTQGFWQLLIDGGPDEQVLTCLQEHLPFWDKTIEMLFITHADQDHIGGLVSVLKQYRVANLFLADATNTQIFDELRTLLFAQLKGGLVVNQPFFGQNISLNSVLKMTVIAPNDNFSLQKNAFFDLSSETILSDYLNFLADNVTEHNARSIVLLLEIANVHILLTGDLEQVGEQALIEQGLINKIDILKVGHHGAKTSSSLQFLEAIQPEIAVISCAKFNQFNHPHPEVLANLNKVGAKILRTDQPADLEFIFTNNFYYLLN